MSASDDQGFGSGDDGGPSDARPRQPVFPDARRRLAVLIDAENANHKTTPELLATIEAHGTAVIRRAYGDWRSSNLDVWRSVIATYAIRPMQRAPIRSGSGRGRNASDIALVVDAMDLLHAAAIDGFCIVSSDSDFADLALRIREAGKIVIGVGRTTTPAAFKACCTIFIETDLAVPPSKAGSGTVSGEAERVAAYRRAIDLAAKDNGWARLTELGCHVEKALRAPKPARWLRGRAEFEVASRRFNERGPEVPCVRLRLSPDS